MMSAFAKSLTVVSTLFLLIACGGGGSLERDSTSGGGTTTDPTYTITLSVQNQSGEDDKSLSVDNPLTVIATVKDESGNALSDTLVTFTFSQDELAEWGNDTGTARTDENGQATIGITVGTLSGDGQITATIASGETGTTTFSSTGGGQSSTQPAILELYASAVQLASSGSDTVELIALVKNAQSVLMEGVDVSFSAPADAGVEMQLVQSTTAEDGTARAILSTQNNATNRTVTVTAQAGSLSQTVDIEVFGTEVTINGTSSIILNDSVDLTIRVQDSDGVAIPNQTVALSASSGTLASTSVVTGTDGQATVTYTGTTSGSDTIIASALNASTSFVVTVQEDEFTFTTVPTAEIPLGTAQSLTVTWNKDGVAYANGDVSFTASRGTITAGATGTTDANGQASFTIQSDNAGVAAITATGEDADGNQVSARVSIEFIATSPATLQADASPDLIGPDGQTSTITAIVRDAEGNLVKGSVISFNIDDTSTGSISPSQATTDSNGVASTVFTSGSVTSENAVTITATVSDTPAVFDTVNLTVGNRAFDVSIGTGNLVSKPDDATYLKEFAVFVTDSVGRPVQGVSLTASSVPVKRANGGVYRKGYWIWTGTAWTITTTSATGLTATCDNEDLPPANGILDAGEDYNGDGFLTPGIVGTLSFKDTNVTDENGQATLELRYPRAYAAWYDAQITVFAQSTGSEASASMKFTLTAAADDLKDESSPPPPSPFGTGTLCTDTN